MASLPRPTPSNLLEAVSRYRSLLTRMTQKVGGEDAPTLARYLGLSMTRYYVKRRGERPFNYVDVTRLVERYGSEQDRDDLQTFITIRNGLFTRLQHLPIPLVAFRRLLGLQHYRDLARRRDHPDTWRLEELEQIGTYLSQIGQV